MDHIDEDPQNDIINHILKLKSNKNEKDCSDSNDDKNKVIFLNWHGLEIEHVI